MIVSSVTFLVSEFQLPAGMHVHTFQCMLPPDLPSSILREVGHIKHNVQIVVDTPMCMNKVFTEEFIVIKSIDLNLNPSARVIFPFPELLLKYSI